jgi:hypothetical protein
MLSNDQLGVKLNHSAMSAQCPHRPKADVDPRLVMLQKCQEATLALRRKSLAAYSITSSASATKFTGNSMPVAFAVLRLMTSL